MPCPDDRFAEAVTLALSEMAPSQRSALAAALAVEDADSLPGHGLIVALRGEHMCGAAWVQRQPGNTAVFWPPQLSDGEAADTGFDLARAARDVIRRANFGLVQSLLSPLDSDHVSFLNAAGFDPLAILLYLSCTTDPVSSHGGNGGSDLEFAAYDESQQARLAKLIERTYDGTLDCAALNGVRQMDDVIDGYRASGVFKEENWLFVRQAEQDIGVLLLAEYPADEYMELVYMGLSPEVRGRGLGRQIALHAISIARRADARRIVLAVDAANKPALQMYHSVGFETWDRRLVYVRVSH